MQESDNSYWGWIIIIVFILFLWYSDNTSLTQTIENLNYEIEDLESKLDDYKVALGEANNVIEEASSYAWASYEEMGEVLEGLETVSEPY